MQEISMIIKAAKGIPLDPDSVITQLTDIKNILERTRFPTYPILGKHVYLRLIAAANRNAKACKLWSDTECAAFVSYKGQSRSETVEMNKAAQPSTQQFYLGERGQQPQQQEQKKHWWSQGPKKEEASEFVE